MAVPSSPRAMAWSAAASAWRSQAAVSPRARVWWAIWTRGGADGLAVGAGDVLVGGLLGECVAEGVVAGAGFA